MAAVCHNQCMSGPVTDWRAEGGRAYLNEPPRRTWPIRMKHLAILLGFLGLFLVFAYPSVFPTPYAYDEADYMYAATRGFIANYLDVPSLSFVDYVRLGMSVGKGANEKAAASAAVRRSGDMFLYRHAHGPIYFYWLGFVSRFGAAEQFIRGSGLIFPMVTAVAIYLGCLLILPAPQGQMAAILGCALYLFSAPVVRVTELAPHQMFTVWFVVALLLAAGLMKDGSRRFWYAAVVVTALAFCTLEVTFVLIAVVLFCGYLERKRLGFDWHLAWRSAGLFAAVVIVVHPAAVTRLAFAKSYLFYAYLAVKRSAPWGNVTLAGTWLHRFSVSPVSWVLIAAALLLWMRYRDLPGWRQALPFLLFGAAMLATMLRVLTTGLRYVLPFFPALLVFTAIVLSGALVRLRPGLRAGLAALACAALFADVYRYTAARPVVPETRLTRLLGEIRQGNLSQSRLLVPHDDLPTVHYYFPEARLTPYEDERVLPAGSFDAVVRLSDPVKIDRVAGAAH